jgi:DedD protein
LQGEVAVALEDRLKQRLTGAAILVALVVLIVPEMFQGRPAQRSAQLPAAPNGAPVRSYTLNLDEHGPTTAPVSAAASATAQVPPLAASSPEPVRPPPADTASDASATAPNVSVPTEHVVVAEHAPTAAARTATPAAHATGGSSRPPGTAAGGKVGWTVQLGSFQQAENARHMAQKLAAKGVKCVVVGPDARGYYRVRTPEVADMPAAESQRQKLLQLGLKGVIGTTP